MATSHYVNEQTYAKRAWLIGQSVLQYDADNTGVASSHTAFANAVAALPATGGKVIVPAGTYLLSSPVVITTNRVYFELDPGATINISSSTYGFHWQGTSAAAPGSYGGIRGGRLIADGTGCDAAIYVQNFLFMRFEGIYAFGFYTAAGGGSRAFFKADYTFGSQFVANDVRWCDIGYDIGQDTGLAYRPTSLSWQGGKVGRCGRGLYLRDVFGFEINAEFIAENCSVGVHCYGDKSTAGQTNCADGDIRGYFEGNGKHVLIESNSSARSVGISLENALLEGVQTDYDGSPVVAMESFGTGSPGDYKVEIDGDRCIVNGCYWSTTAGTADLLIDAGATNTLVGFQLRDYSTVSDAGTATIFSALGEIGTLPTADATPSVSGLSVCTITNASAQTITALDGGYDGQIVQIRAMDNNTTFQHAATGAGLRLWGAEDYKIIGGQTIEFTHFGSSIWVQTGLSQLQETYAKRYDAQWTDLVIEATAINPPGAATDPARNSTTGLLEFSASADNLITGCWQMPHAWAAQEDSTKAVVVPHMHVRHLTSTAAPNNVSRWKFEYDVADPNGNFVNAYGAFTTHATVSSTNPANTAKASLVSFGNLDLAGYGASALLYFRVSRLASSDAADTDTSVVALYSMDLHYQGMPGTDTEIPT